MEHSLWIQLFCLLYFYSLAVLGFWTGLDAIKGYKWPNPGFELMAFLLFITSPIFMGVFPMIIIGVFAAASIHTGLQEKRKGKEL